MVLSKAIVEFSEQVFPILEGVSGIWGTCFYVETRKVGILADGKDNDKHIFATALHVVSSANPKIAVQMRDGKFVPGERIASDARSDLAFFQVSESKYMLEDWAPDAVIQPEISVGQRVFIIGFGQQFSKKAPSVLHAIISNTSAGDDVPGPAAAAAWKTRRFFVIDRTTDYSFSGSPVVNKWGQVIGILCESNFVGVSWALHPLFIAEGIEVAGSQCHA